MSTRSTRTGNQINKLHEEQAQIASPIGDHALDASGFDVFLLYTICMADTLENSWRTWARLNKIHPDWAPSHGRTFPATPLAVQRANFVSLSSLKAVASGSEERVTFIMLGGDNGAVPLRKARSILVALITEAEAMAIPEHWCSDLGSLADLGICLQAVASRSGGSPRLLIRSVSSRSDLVLRRSPAFLCREDSE